MKRITAILIICCMAFAFTACGSTAGNMAEAIWPSAREAATTKAEGETAPAAREFIESFLSAEQALLETLIINMREGSEDFLDALAMDVVYLNDAGRIRFSLESAVDVFEDDTTGTGDTRTRKQHGGSTVQDGKIVPVEHTFTARYEGNRGRLTIEITDERGRPVSSTECVKTQYGYIAQYYEHGDSYFDIPSFHVLISLRDTEGMIGMEPRVPQPKELTGEEAFDLPQTLRDWFALEDGAVKVHSAEGANTEFAAITPRKETDAEIKAATMPDQSYLGVWRTADGEEELTISEITEDRIVFNLSIFRLANIDATATLEADGITFAGEDPGGNPLYGTLAFPGDTVVLKIDEQSWGYELPSPLTFVNQES